MSRAATRLPAVPRPSDRPLWFGSGVALLTLGGICFAGMLDISPIRGTAA
jgi:hypothetical protein